MIKQRPVSAAERRFVTQAIKQDLRLDGRKNGEHRRIDIHFGREWGSVIVMLGETKVVGQVSGELGIPLATRPTEGLLYINVEVGPMAAPHFEAGRHSELSVKLNRILERTVKDSRCVDLESLCVVAEEHVWILRINLNVLNHMGNVIDCSSIAALCALAHFRRPQVTIIKDEVKIYTAAQKELIPMVMHHYPVCVSYSTFNDGSIAVADPTAIEERCAESLMLFGLNSCRELCVLNLGGLTMISPSLLLKYAHKAAAHAKYVVGIVKSTLETDQAAREGGPTSSFADCVRANMITALCDDRLTVRLRDFNYKEFFGLEKKEVAPDSEADKNAAVSGEKLDDSKRTIKWVPDEEENGTEDVVDMYSNNSTSRDSSDADIYCPSKILKQSGEETEDTPPPTEPRLPILKDVLPQKNAIETDSEEEEKLIL